MFFNISNIGKIILSVVVILVVFEYLEVVEIKRPSFDLHLFSTSLSRNNFVHNSSTTSTLTEKKHTILYGIMFYCCPHLVARLYHLLNTSDVYFAYHIDRHTDISTKEWQVVMDLKKFNNVIFTDQRITVDWSGASMIYATIQIMRDAIQKNITFDSFFLLSETHYPIMSNQKIMNWTTSRPLPIQFCHSSVAKYADFAYKSVPNLENTTTVYQQGQFFVADYRSCYDLAFDPYVENFLKWALAYGNRVPDEWVLATLFKNWDKWINKTTTITDYQGCCTYPLWPPWSSNHPLTLSLQGLSYNMTVDAIRTGSVFVRKVFDESEEALVQLQKDYGVPYLPLNDFKVAV